jgi:hypothetical protein
MPDKWTTIAEAATVLEVHPRTIERRIRSKRIQSRRTDDGQVQVMIELPEPVGQQSDALSVVADQAENQVQLAVSASSALIKQSQADAALARRDAERAWDETRRVRLGATWAWSMVALMVASSIVAVGWTTYALTKSSAEQTAATNQLRSMSDTVRQVSAERDVLQKQVSDARESAARADGEASALRHPITVSVVAVPSTQPTTRASMHDLLVNTPLEWLVR